MISYSELKQKFRQSPKNEQIKALIKLRELFICCASMKYNNDYPDVIYMLTNVEIDREDIEKLTDSLLRTYKTEEKKIHSTNEHLSFLGDMS